MTETPLTHAEEGSLARSIYGEEAISERHRPRYEVNHKYLAAVQEHGLVISGQHQLQFSVSGFQFSARSKPPC